MRREHSGRPLHPFPLLLRPAQPFPPELADEPRSLNAFERRILREMRKGARLLFDMQAKRALLYRWRMGLEQLAELTVRTLARLVRKGYVSMAGQEGRMVHYTLSA